MQTTLITGASSGFGRDTAETLARQGHRVFAGVRDIAGRNAEVAKQLEGKGRHRYRARRDSSTPR
jgi:NAD(P)-dependent dehydrogenase (short-subunit alcohol dehydrogenase family)